MSGAIAAVENNFHLDPTPIADPHLRRKRSTRGETIAWDQEPVSRNLIDEDLLVARA
jgi:hypothetical protein